jgi:radical SAM protein with 4Fe4S-binding SPASM domain
MFIKRPDKIPKTIKPSIPEVYQIETVSICNANCIMCPTPFYPRKDKTPMIDVDLVKKIVDEGDLEASYFVELQQSGEPLLHPKLSEIIDIVKSTGVYVGLSTNGIRTEEQTEALSKLDYITFSFDSLDYYKEIRGKDHDLLRKIKNFLPIADERCIAVDIQIIELEGWEEQLKKTQEVFAGDNVLIRSMPNGYYLYNFPDMENTCRDLCVNPWLSASISCNGNVSACCISTGDGIQLGNIKEQTLAEIWAGEEIEKLREEHMSRNLRYVCDRCYMRSPFLCHWNFYTSSILRRGFK